MTIDPSRRYFLMFGGIFLLISVVHLFSFFRQPRDIWWTPDALRVPIAEADDRVRVYISGVPLLDRLKAGGVLVAGPEGSTPVRESDVSFRFNNWDRVRAERIPALVSYAAGAGAAGVILLFGILGWVPKYPVGPESRQNG